MSFIAVAGLAITAGAAAYTGYQASQTPDDPSAVFGKKPKIAPYTPIDLSEEQKKAAASNLDNADALTALFNKLDPGFSDLLKSGFETSQSLVRGELPQDVQDEIMRSDAYQSLMNGFSGTGMSHALTARDIGRTSLDMFQLGTNSAQKWTKIAEDAYQPFLITTDDQVNAAAANNAGERKAQQDIYNVDAAPDPAAAGMFNLSQVQNQATAQSINQFTSALTKFGSQYGQQGQGTWARPYTGQSYVYDAASGTYVIGGG